MFRQMMAENEIVSTAADLIKLAKEVDFIYLMLVDLNGIPRVRVVPSERVENLLSDGCNSVVCIMTFRSDGSVVMVPDHQKINFGNIRLRPVVETARRWPWWTLEAETSALQVLVTPEWLHGGAIECDPRQIAVAQMKRLHDRGLDMLCGTEIEYRLFQRRDNEAGLPVPAHSTLQMFWPEYATQYAGMFAEIYKRTCALGFKYEAFNTEYGRGQVEFAMEPGWGVKSADDLVRFKMVARDVARKEGYRASFMTKPLAGETGNGFHFNHSVWKRNGKDKPTENVMFDPEDDDKLSQFARHWLAGLLHHSNAITAVSSPTVNCYRRLHTPWAPSFNDWGVENRMATYRYKNAGSDKATCLEHRSPASAANPYLTLATTIAAGLDGVDRKLPLVAAGSKEMGELPKTLADALEALKSDEVMVKALGEQFVDWFSAVKVDELTLLKTVKVKEEREEDFAEERKVYFDAV